jgi:hypothetical protein
LHTHRRRKTSESGDGIIMIQFDRHPRIHDELSESDAARDPSPWLTFCSQHIGERRVQESFHVAFCAILPHGPTDGRINKKLSAMGWMETPPAAVAKLCMRLLHERERETRRDQQLYIGAVKVTRRDSAEMKQLMLLATSDYLLRCLVQPAHAHLILFPSSTRTRSSAFSSRRHIRPHKHWFLVTKLTTLNVYLFLNR